MQISAMIEFDDIPTEETCIVVAKYAWYSEVVSMTPKMAMDYYTEWLTMDKDDGNTPISVDIYAKLQVG